MTKCDLLTTIKVTESKGYEMKISIPYKLRRALALGAIAGGTLVGCIEKTTTPDIPTPTPDEPTPDTPAPTRDVELEFDKNGKNIELENVKKYADMPDVRYIYMTPENEMAWCTCTQGNILNLRKYLEPRIAINPQKVRGKGNFCFKPGEASKNPQDSLWFIQNGWTLNQKQK